MADPVVFKDGLSRWSTASGNIPDAVIPDVKSVELPISKAELANGVMSDSGEVFHPGLISAPIGLTCRQSFATGGIDEEVWTRWNNETKFQAEFAPNNATISASNPAYRFNRVGCFAGTPLSGAHGVLLDNVFALRMLSGCSVVRRTSSGT